MQARESYRNMRKMPAFPLMPLLPMGLLLGTLIVSVLTHRRVRSLERRLDRG